MTKAQNSLSIAGKMKNIVVWLSTSSRVSWLQVWKQMHSWLSLPISTCWWWEETQREVEIRRFSRISCFSEKKKKTSKIVYLKAQIQWILFCGKLKNWDWMLRRDTPEILRMHLVRNWIRERERQSGGIIQNGEPHERNPCAPGFEEQPPEETSRQAGCTSKVAWNLGRKIWKLKAEDNATFYISCGKKRRQRHRRSFFCYGFGSFNAQCWAMDILAQIQWILWEGPKRHKRLTAIGDRANKRVSVSFVHDFDLFVTVQLLDETPVTLLLHKLCSKRGYS